MCRIHLLEELIDFKHPFSSSFRVTYWKRRTSSLAVNRLALSPFLLKHPEYVNVSQTESISLYTILTIRIEEDGDAKQNIRPALDATLIRGL